MDPTQNSTTEQSLPHKLAAILYADVEGYSRLTGADEAGTHRTLSAYLDFFTETIKAHRGEVKHFAGDAVLADFTTVSDALNCAIAVQHGIKEKNQAIADNKRVQFRIGLNLGEVIVDRDEVYGNGVNVAARLETLAEPGGICISGAARDAIGNKLSLEYEYLGEQQVKNIDAPVRAYRVGFENYVAPMRVVAPTIKAGRRWPLVVAAGVAMIGFGAWLALSRQSPPLPSPIVPAAIPSTPAKANRIAVLPFANLSADKDNEYFSDGITEEMISKLSRVSGLEVIARTSAMSYKGTTKKIAEIAKELNVGSVLEGSVRKEGNTVRITAQLIRADNEAHLWSEDYEQDLKNVLGIQKTIAERVAQALTAKLSVVTGAAHDSQGTQNTEAYNAYLKGRFHANKSTLDGVQTGVQYFQEAIRLDPAFALAYVGLSDAYEQLPLQDDAFSKQVYPKARIAAQKAIELDPDLPEAHAALAVVKTFYDYDWDGAERDFQRALKLNPNSSASLWWYTWHQIFLRKMDQGLATMKRAVELDPLSIAKNTDLGWAYQFAGRWKESIAQLQRTMELEPGNTNGLGALGWAYLGDKQYDKADEVFRKEVEAFGREPWALTDVVNAYALRGDDTRTLQILDEINSAAKTTGVSGWVAAVSRFGMATRDKRFHDELYRGLDQAFQERSYWLVHTSNAWWKPFHQDSRWIAFRKKMGLPP